MTSESQWPDPGRDDVRPVPADEPEELPFAKPTLRDIVAAQEGRQPTEAAPLREFAPRPLVTHTLVALNAAVFVAMLVTGVSPMSPIACRRSARWTAAR